MIYRKVQIVLLIILLVPVLPGTGHSGPTGRIAGGTRVRFSPGSLESTPDQAASFSDYWKEFRAAVLGRDFDRVFSLTEFPVETRGELDDDPVVEYTRSRFRPVWDLFLQQWAGDTAGKSELDVIRETQAPEAKISHGQVRIADMVFFLSKGKWKLNFLYLQPDTIDSLRAATLH